MWFNIVIVIYEFNYFCITFLCRNRIYMVWNIWKKILYKNWRKGAHWWGLGLGPQASKSSPGSKHLLTSCISYLNFLTCHPSFHRNNSLSFLSLLFQVYSKCVCLCDRHEASGEEVQQHWSTHSEGEPQGHHLLPHPAGRRPTGGQARV